LEELVELTDYGMNGFFICMCLAKVAVYCDDFLLNNAGMFCF